MLNRGTCTENRRQMEQETHKSDPSELKWEHPQVKAKPARDASAVAPIKPKGFTHYASKTSQNARQTSATFPRAASASCIHQANKLHTAGQQGLNGMLDKRLQHSHFMQAQLHLTSHRNSYLRPARPPKPPGQQGLRNHQASLFTQTNKTSENPPGQ